jgi:hypothetical protein
MLIGGDRPNVSIISDINLFAIKDPKELLNPIYGFIWANCGVVNNYYNFSPDYTIQSKLIKLLFTQNLQTREITPSKSVKIPIFLQFGNNTLQTHNTNIVLGVIIGLLYKHLQTIRISNRKNNNKLNASKNNNVMCQPLQKNNSVKATNIASRKNKSVPHMKTKKVCAPTYLKISTLPQPTVNNNGLTKKITDINAKIKSFNEKILKGNVPANVDDKTIIDIINILLALLWWNSNDIDGIKDYYRGIKLALPEEEINIDYIADYNTNKFASKIQDIYNILVKLKLFDTGTAINTHVLRAKRVDKNSGDGFSDCGETTIRNLINICCAGQDNNTIILERLNTLGAIDGVLAYYNTYNTISKQNTQVARNEWSLLVSNLDGVKYSETNIDGYKFDIDSGLVASNNNKGKPNLLVAISKILSRVREWQDFSEFITITGNLTNGIGDLKITKETSTYILKLEKNHFYIYAEGSANLQSITKYINDLDEPKKLYVYGLLANKYDVSTLTYFSNYDSWVYYIYGINVEKFKMILEYFYNIGKELSKTILLQNNVNNKLINNINSLTKKKSIELLANTYITLLNHFNNFGGDVYKRVKSLSMFLIKHATYSPELQKLINTLLLYGIKINDEHITLYDNITSIEVSNIYHFNDGFLPKHLQDFTDAVPIISIHRIPTLTKGFFPASLKKLTFGVTFTNGDKPLTNDMFPETLESLSFGDYFTNGKTPLHVGIFPETLECLTFGKMFNNGGNRLDKGIFPESLKKLTFGNDFTNGDKPLTNDIFPEKLESLTFGEKFTNAGYSLQMGVLPQNLKTLTFGQGFTNGGNPLCVSKLIPTIIPDSIKQKICET